MMASILSLLLAGTVMFDVSGTAGKRIRVGGFVNEPGEYIVVDWGDGWHSELDPSNSCFNTYHEDVSRITVTGVSKVGGIRGFYQSFWDGGTDSTWRASVDNTLIGVRTVGVSEIGSHAFCNCRNLRTFEMDDSVVKFGHAAIANCDNLRELVLPSSVRCIGTWNVVNNHHITNITMTADNDVFYCRDKAIIHRGDDIVVMSVGKVDGCTNYVDGAMAHGDVHGTYTIIQGLFPEEPTPVESLEIRPWEGTDPDETHFAIRPTGSLSWPLEWLDI